MDKFVYTKWFQLKFVGLHRDLRESEILLIGCMRVMLEKGSLLFYKLSMAYVCVDVHASTRACGRAFASFGKIRCVAVWLKV